MRRTSPIASSDRVAGAAAAALILADAHPGIQAGNGDAPLRFEGMDLVEWAAMTARRAGINRIHIAGTTAVGGDVLSRLRRRGMTVSAAAHDGRPFQAAPTNDTVVVLS